MSAHSKPNLSKEMKDRRSPAGKFVNRDADSDRLVLFPTEPSAIGRRRIQHAVARVAARKK